MIKFDDKDIQKAFNECHFRIEFDGVDVCRCMCAPCTHIIDHGQCPMLKEYFTKYNLTTAMSFRCKEVEE